MTSELKPDYEKFTREICQFAFEGCDASGGEIQEIGIKYGVLTAETFSHEKHVDVVNGEDFEEGDTIYCFAPSRAVPDVPELVRYRLNSLGELVYSENGSYVLHSQAAEIIAAKQYAYDVEYNSLVDRHNQAVQQIEKWIDTCSELEQRAEAAEAKLAQYEAQEPIGVIHQGIFYSMADIEEYPEYQCGTKIYTSPAPAADLKAYNQRLREALEFYADKANWETGDFQHSVDEHLGHNVLTLNMPQAVNDQGKIARSALNVEASHG